MVVDVKSGPTLEREDRTSALDDALRDRPGWSYGVVPVKLGDQLEVPKGAVVLTREGVLSRVVGAERLLEAGFPEAAFVQAWSAADGALRVLLEEEAELVGWPTSKYVISLAEYEGVISHDCSVFLRDSLSKSTALAHGYAVPATDAASVRDVIDVAMRLAVEGELDWYPSSM